MSVLKLKSKIFVLLYLFFLYGLTEVVPLEVIKNSEESSISFYGEIKNETTLPFKQSAEDWLYQQMLLFLGFRYQYLQVGIDLNFAGGYIIEHNKQYLIYWLEELYFFYNSPIISFSIGKQIIATGLTSGRGSRNILNLVNSITYENTLRKQMTQGSIAVETKYFFDLSTYSLIYLPIGKEVDSFSRKSIERILAEKGFSNIKNNYDKNDFRNFSLIITADYKADLFDYGFSYAYQKEGYFNAVVDTEYTLGLSQPTKITMNRDHIHTFGFYGFYPLSMIGVWNQIVVNFNEDFTVQKNARFPSLTWELGVDLFKNINQSDLNFSFSYGGTLRPYYDKFKDDKVENLIMDEERAKKYYNQTVNDKISYSSELLYQYLSLDIEHVYYFLFNQFISALTFAYGFPIGYHAYINKQYGDLYFNPKLQIVLDNNWGFELGLEYSISISVNERNKIQLNETGKYEIMSKYNNIYVTINYNWKE